MFPDTGDTSGDDWAMQVLADHQSDLTYAEIVTTIDDLEPDQQVTLVALMWLGRGDFEADDWESALAQAGEQATPRTAAYRAHPDGRGLYR